MTDTPTKIRWSKVHKRFGSKVVLDGLDLDAKEGRSLVVIGGSGTGKSVLLKCALGLLAPEKGCVEIDGTNVKAGRHDDAGIAQIGMLFQSGALFDSLPVWENIAFRLIQHDKMKRAEARDRAISALKQVELDEDTGAKYPSELSGGMLKRAALARAIVSQPKILFFDEPTTGLDPVTADVINHLIRHQVTQLGATAVSITHDMASMRVIADDVAMIDAGQIRWQGPLDAVDQTKDEKVRRFVKGRGVDQPAS